MNPRTCAIVLIALLASRPAHANDSAYTDLDTERCTLLAKDDGEGGGISLQCKGLGSYPVYFKEGDLRQSILYGPVNAAYIDGVFESFEPFNHTGRKIEWRLGRDGKPVATILRWFTENIDPATGKPSAKVQGQVLVVSKVAEKDGTACIVGYVDALANPEPNTLARQVADTKVDGFVCGRDTPGFAGIRGPTASEPTRIFPE